MTVLTHGQPAGLHGPSESVVAAVQAVSRVVIVVTRRPWGGRDSPLSVWQVMPVRPQVRHVRCSTPGHSMSSLRVVAAPASSVAPQLSGCASSVARSRAASRSSGSCCFLSKSVRLGPVTRPVRGSLSFCPMLRLSLALRSCTAAPVPASSSPVTMLPRIRPTRCCMELRCPGRRQSRSTNCGMPRNNWRIDSVKQAFWVAPTATAPGPARGPWPPCCSLRVRRAPSSELAKMAP